MIFQFLIQQHVLIFAPSYLSNQKPYLFSFFITSSELYEQARERNVLKVLVAFFISHICFVFIFQLIFQVILLINWLTLINWRKKLEFFWCQIENDKDLTRSRVGLFDWKGLKRERILHTDYPVHEKQDKVVPPVIIGQLYKLNPVWCDIYV